MKKFSITIFILSTIIVACSRKLNPEQTNITKPRKEITTNYKTMVSDLISTKCTPCHLPTKGGFKTSLDNYDAVKKYISDIIVRVQLPSSEKNYMPFKKPPLTKEEINLLIKWNEEGMPE